MNLVDCVRGKRLDVGMVSVDAGCVSISARGCSVYATNFVRSSTFRAGPDWCVSSTSGFGDGGYEVLVVDRDGVVGLEVVFICEAASAAADEARTSTGVAGPHPGWEVTEEERDAWAERDALEWRAANDAFLEALLDIDPHADSVGRVLGVFTHDGSLVEVSDPFCAPSGPTDLPLPAGNYVAVRWEADFGTLGVRATRLGVYRCDSARLDV